MMPPKKMRKEAIKKLHLNVPESIHQRLRVKCAIENRTMQDFVTALVERAVKDVQVPLSRKGGE